tara:strand:+ start:799 stop:1005 length:207 start_codon:yes stop_codon:yes gene_type:complete
MTNTAEMLQLFLEIKTELQEVISRLNNKKDTIDSEILVRIVKDINKLKTMITQIQEERSPKQKQLGDY